MIDTYDNNKKIVASWLKEMSSALETELALDEEGICTIQLGENQIIAIEVARDFDMIYIYSPLKTLPKEDVDANIMLMANALELNAFQMHTRGGAIGIIPNSQVLIYSISLPLAGMDAEMFSNALLEFREATQELQAMLASNIPETPPKNLHIGKPGSQTIIKM